METTGLPVFVNLSTLDVKQEIHYHIDQLDGPTTRSSIASSAVSCDNDIFSVSPTGTRSPETPATTSQLQLHSDALHEGVHLPIPFNLPDGPLCDFKSYAVPTNISHSDGLDWSDQEGASDFGRTSSSMPTEYDLLLRSLQPSEHHMRFAQSFSDSVGNPSLSRSIFQDVLPAHAISSTLVSQNWLTLPPASQPHTIDPTETFHPILAPSPMFREPPATPVTLSSPSVMIPSSSFTSMSDSSPAAFRTPITPLRSSSVSFCMNTSSPSVIYSPRIVPSQRAIEDLSYGKPCIAADFSPADFAAIRHATTGRLSRKSYIKKNLRTATRGPKPASTKSGFDCPEIIPQNGFSCKYKDCINKSTGLAKAFKRQEHKKRHEKTVHEKDVHQQHPCWVPGCKAKAFSRSDNLKSHQKKTHGRRNCQTRRNPYVATLDETNEFYNPDWIGLLDTNGNPIFDAEHPRFEYQGDD